MMTSLKVARPRTVFETGALNNQRLQTNPHFIPETANLFQAARFETLFGKAVTGKRTRSKTASLRQLLLSSPNDGERKSLIGRVFRTQKPSPQTEAESV